jgi:hypothetical protein
MAGLFKPGGGVRTYLRGMPSTGMPALDARSDFLRARRSARLRRLTRRRRSHPRTIGEVAGRGAPHLEVIRLGCIVGTVEPSPHFDARFRPASAHLRARWERIALAHRRGVSLPPIAVVARSDGYYVVDGRHRVSVALASGLREIEAWVS